MSEYLHLKGTLTGHSGWVTSIATTMQDNQDVLISGSRGASSRGIAAESVPGTASDRAIHLPSYLLSLLLPLLTLYTNRQEPYPVGPDQERPRQRGRSPQGSHWVSDSRWLLCC